MKNNFPSVENFFTSLFGLTPVFFETLFYKKYMCLLFRNCVDFLIKQSSTLVVLFEKRRTNAYKNHSGGSTKYGIL